MEMCVCVLHAAVAQRGKALIVPSVTVPDADGGVTVKPMPALEFPDDATMQQIAQACWDAGEEQIRREPGLWLWAYKHFRYRPRDAQREYPSYANTSGAFEKLRKSELPAVAEA